MFANIVKRHVLDAKISRQVHALPTPVNGIVILLMIREGFISAKPSRTYTDEYRFSELHKR